MKSEEYKEQCTFAQWLNIKKIPFFHIPNGGKRGVLEASRLKKMGVKAGIPDIFIHVPVDPYAGLFVEMKKKKGGSLSLSQKLKIVELNALGYCALTAEGCDEAIKITEAYLKLMDKDKRVCVG